MPILEYEIEAEMAPDDWQIVGATNSIATIGVAGALTPGALINLRVVAKNSVATEYGAYSEVIQLTPAALPGASGDIRVAEYGENYLLLEWDVPTDTGAGD